MRWIHHQPLGLGQKLVVGVMMAAVVVVMFTGWRAWTISPLPPPAGSSMDAAVPELRERVSYPLRSALRAVARDPFHPDRRAPEARYLLPEIGQENASAVAETYVSSPFQLLGTVVNESNGGFVMARVGRDAPRMVYVGDTLNGMRLRRVARASAEFVSDLGDTLTVELPSASGGANR